MQHSHDRIKLARRQGKLSQRALAEAVGVQRSAVSHWESAKGKNPTLSNLRKVADRMAVHFEWLATGRGPMALSPALAGEGIPTARALLVEDAVEMRMVRALRSASLSNRLALVEIAEQLAVVRTGRTPAALDRSTAAAEPCAVDELPPTLVDHWR